MNATRHSAGFVPARKSGDIAPERAFAFFRLGRGDVPLALIGGGLILDSGEAENTFVFRCQDRFLVYTSLLGLRSIVFVLDDAHRRHYQGLLKALDQRLRNIAELHGVAAPRLPEPLYVPCDLHTLALSDAPFLADAARALAAAGQSVCFVANQLSPTTARMLGELAALLRGHGVTVELDEADCAPLAALAQHWHNKANFLTFERGAAVPGGPPQVPTWVLSAQEFLALPDWDALAGRFALQSGLDAPPEELFIKSAQDSSGNVSALLSRSNHAQCAPPFAQEVRRWLLAEQFDDPRHVHELRAECERPPSLEAVSFSDATLAALRRAQAGRRQGLSLLVQPVVREAQGANLPARLPTRLGVSLFIEKDGTSRIVALAAQLYRDAQRRQFFGMQLDAALERSIAARRFAAQCQELAEAMATRGYRGPVNFDACLDDIGQYRFVGDCNPRLTALYAPLAVQAWLRAAGVRADSVIGLGYRGDFVIPDLPATLQAWAEAGLLFTRERPQGLLLLPNLARRDGHDVLAINLGLAEARQHLARMQALTPGIVPAALEDIHG